MKLFSQGPIFPDREYLRGGMVLYVLLHVLSSSKYDMVSNANNILCGRSFDHLKNQGSNVLVFLLFE